MLSSTACLRKIRENTEEKNLVIDEERIRKACVENNFNPAKATESLIREESIKHFIKESLNIQNHILSDKIIEFVCIRYNYNKNKSLHHVNNIIMSRTKLLEKLQCNNITFDKNNIDWELFKCFGNADAAYYNIVFKD